MSLIFTIVGISLAINLTISFIFYKVTLTIIKDMNIHVDNFNYYLNQYQINGPHF